MEMKKQPSLEEMKAVDIKTVDKRELVDLRDVVIDPTKPIEQRIDSFLQQIRNPYCFKVGDVAVKVNYQSGGPTFQQVFSEIIMNS